MLRQREAVRHSRHIVADEPRRARFLALHRLRRQRPFAGHQLGIPKEGEGQAAHNFGRLHAHLHHPGMAVHVGIEEALDGLVCGLHGVGKGHHGPVLRPHVGGAQRTGLREARAPLANGVLDEAGDEASAEFVDEAIGLQPRMARVDLAHEVADEIDRAQVLDGEEPGAQAIVDVVGVVGHVIGYGGGLGLGAGEAGEIERQAGVELHYRHGQPPRGVFGNGRAVAPQQRAIVLDQPLQRLPGEVQAVVIGVALLQTGDDAQGLGVVVKAPIGLHDLLQRILARMAEGGVAEIVGQRQRLRQILVEAQGAGDGAGDLADLDGVCQARAVVVALVGHEDLGLVGQPAEGRGMDDAVAVALVFRARGRGRLGKQSPPAQPRVHRIGRMIGGIRGLHGQSLALSQSGALNARLSALISTG